MDSQQQHHIDPNAGMGWTAAVFAFASNVLAWLSVPSNMELLNHTVGTIAGLLGGTMAVIRIRDYYKRRKDQ